MDPDLVADLDALGIGGRLRHHDLVRPILSGTPALDESRTKHRSTDLTVDRHADRAEVTVDVRRELSCDTHRLDPGKATQLFDPLVIDVRAEHGEVLCERVLTEALEGARGAT